MSVERYYPRRSCRSPQLRMSGPSWSPAAPARGSVAPSSTNRSARGGSIDHAVDTARSVSDGVVVVVPAGRRRGGGRRRRRCHAQRVGARRSRRGSRRRHDHLRARCRPPVRLVATVRSGDRAVSARRRRGGARRPGHRHDQADRRRRRRRRHPAAVDAGRGADAAGVPRGGAPRRARQRSSTPPTTRRSSRSAAGESWWSPGEPTTARSPIPKTSRGRASWPRRKADERRPRRPGFRHPPLQRRPRATAGARRCRLRRSPGLHGHSDADVIAHAVDRRAARRRRPRRHRRALPRHRPAVEGRRLVGVARPRRHTGACRWLDHRQRRLLGGVRDAEVGAAPSRDAGQA